MNERNTIPASQNQSNNKAHEPADLQARDAINLDTTKNTQLQPNLNRNLPRNPAFRYLLKDYLKELAPFYGVIVAIVAVGLIIKDSTHSDVTFSGFGGAAAICLLVYGIVSPRPNLRLCIQLGVSRRTAFLSQALAVLLSMAVLSTAGEILCAIGQAVGGFGKSFVLTDMYQLFYLDFYENMQSMTLVQHINSMFFNLSLMALFFAFGMFLTFLFWRLNKFWTIVVAVAMPVLLIALPILPRELILRSSALNRLLANAAELLSTSVWSAVMLFFAIAAAFTLFAWLLVRHTNIRSPQSN